MKSTALLSLAAAAVMAVSCSSLRPEQKGPKETVTIRYMNLGSVYEILRNRSETAASLKKEREQLQSRMREIEEKLLSGAGDRKKLTQDLQSLRDGSGRLDKKEQAFKEEILKKISTAVEVVAKEIGADFVLNMGDEVLYSQKKYDITEEVIREVMRQEQRRDPVVR